MTVVETQTRQNQQTKELQLEISRSGIDIWRIIVTFCLIAGFILSFRGFWRLELLLWNRFEYSTGSLYVNITPIYRDYALESLLPKFALNINIFLVGVGLVFCSNLYLYFRYLISTKTHQNVRLLMIFSAISTGFISVMGWWLKSSIIVIHDIPGYHTEQAGLDWLNDISGYATQITQIGNLVWWVFLFSIPLVLILVFKYREKKFNLTSKNKKQKTKLRQVNFKEKLFQILENLSNYLILGLYMIFTLFPVYLTIITSISSPYEIINGVLPREPFNSFVLNYSTVLFAQSIGYPSFQSAFMNSVLIAGGSSLFGMFISLTAAYAISRFKFKINRKLNAMILSTQMFPGLILLIPQVIIFARLGLLRENTKVFGLLLASASGATAYCTWMMKGYFDTIPIDMEEAAQIDGASRFKTFIRIALPLAKAGMVAVMLYTFLSAWQEFVLARTFLGNVRDPKSTLPLLFYMYTLGAADAPTFYELLAPYSIIVATPVIIFFMLIQKQLAAGSIAGGVK